MARTHASGCITLEASLYSPIRALMMKTKFVSDMVAYLYHLTRLSAQEDFIEHVICFNCH